VGGDVGGIVPTCIVPVVDPQAALSHKSHAVPMGGAYLLM
jgi:hypothetical protein